MPLKVAERRRQEPLDISIGRASASLASKQLCMRRMHVLAFAGNNVHPQICTDIKNAAPSWPTGKDGDRLIRWTDIVVLVVVIVVVE